MTEPTLSPQHLRNTILLVQEALLVHLVQQAALPIPARDRLQVLHALRLRADVAHLDHDERVLVRGPGGEQDVCVELARAALDAVAEVLDQRGRCRAVEAAAVSPK